MCPRGAGPAAKALVHGNTPNDATARHSTPRVRVRGGAHPADLARPWPRRTHPARSQDWRGVRKISGRSTVRAAAKIRGDFARPAHSRALGALLTARRTSTMSRSSTASPLFAGIWHAPSRGSAASCAARFARMAEIDDWNEIDREASTRSWRVRRQTMHLKRLSMSSTVVNRVAQKRDESRAVFCCAVVSCPVFRCVAFSCAARPRRAANLGRARHGGDGMFRVFDDGARPWSAGRQAGTRGQRPEDRGRRSIGRDARRAARKAPPSCALGAPREPARAICEVSSAPWPNDRELPFL